MNIYPILYKIGDWVYQKKWCTSPSNKYQQSLGLMAIFNGLILWSAFFPQQSLSEEVIYLTNGEWPPYSSENLVQYGIFSQIVSQAFLLENIRVKYVFFPWKRGYVEALKGKYDGSITWARTPERELDFYFTDPVILSRKVFFHLRSNPLMWKTIEDLKNTDIGVTIGYTYGNEFDQALKNRVIRVQKVVSDKQNVAKLLAGRIDIFPMEINVGLNLIASTVSADEAAQITYHPKPLLETSFAVIISKNIGEERAMYLTEAFNRGIKKLKKSGQYDNIYRQVRPANKKN